jgi:hypothetical protein
MVSAPAAVHSESQLLLLGLYLTYQWEESIEQFHLAVLTPLLRIVILRLCFLLLRSHLYLSSMPLSYSPTTSSLSLSRETSPFTGRLPQ